jgi:hypothetical protein
MHRLLNDIKGNNLDDLDYHHEEGDEKVGHDPKSWGRSSRGVETANE